MIFNCFKIKPWTFAGKTKNAKVINVYDGDTITIAMWIGFQKYSFKLRLFGIDTPEIRSADKEKAIIARDYLKNIILNKKVKITFDKEEKYGRLLGIVYYNNKNINNLMVEKGYAKVYFGGKKE
jgi:micrococcal nuclease